MDSARPKVKESNDEMANDMSERIDELLLSDSDEEFPAIECDLCGKMFSSVNMYEQHLNSKKHHQAVIKLKLRQKLRKDAPKQEAANNVDDSPPNTDVNEDLYCDVCNKEFSGYIPYMSHLRGNIHAKCLRQQKLKEEIKGTKEFLEDESLDCESDEDGIFQKPFAHCTPCQKTLYGPEAYQQHMNGVNHKKKLKNLKLIDDMRKDEDLENGIDDNEAFFKCEVCNKSFSGPVPYKMHLKSLVHEKELKRVEAEKELSEFFLKDRTGGYMCKECKKIFPNLFSLKSHLANNSHGKQKVKDEMFGFVSSNPEVMAVKSVQNVSLDEESEEKDNFQNGQYFLVCKLCHMSFSGPESAQDHLKSRNHAKAKREKAERKFLKEKMKAKLSGCPSSDVKGLNNGVSKNGSKMPATNEDKTDSASGALNAEDFEIL